MNTVTIQLVADDAQTLAKILEQDFRLDCQ